MKETNRYFNSFAFLFTQPFPFTFNFQWSSPTNPITLFDTNPFSLPLMLTTTDSIPIIHYYQDLFFLLTISHTTSYWLPLHNLHHRAPSFEATLTATIASNVTSIFFNDLQRMRFNPFSKIFDDLFVNIYSILKFRFTKIQPLDFFLFLSM